MRLRKKTEYTIATADGPKAVEGYVLPFEPSLALRKVDGWWRVDHLPTGYVAHVFGRPRTYTTKTTLGSLGKPPTKTEALRRLLAASVVPVPWGSITVENVGEYDKLMKKWSAMLREGTP